MSPLTPFDPGAIYAPRGTNEAAVPRVFIAPQRYVQGDGVLEHTGRYLALMKVSHVALLASPRGLAADAGRLIPGFETAGLRVLEVPFGGECSRAELEARVGEIDGRGVDCLVAAGGGKCVDAGKAIAWRLGVPLVVVPTLASNDAPCSALSVLYTPEGVTESIEFYPQSPALVVVDTSVVAHASERYLAAGMGDAMATWYEARVCLENPRARTPLGARPTLASCALGEVCASTLYEHGEAAARAVRARAVDDALDRVVEANTLLSGLGFESGGIAAAHGIAQSYPLIDRVRENYLHGELVGMGLLAQLVLEGRAEEARRAATFFSRIGLPVHLAQLSLAPDHAELDAVAQSAVAFPLTHNLPFEVTAQNVRNAILDAHALGLEVANAQGDAAYRRLQAG